MTSWYDEEWGIDFILYKDKEGKYRLSANGQGHLPIEDEAAAALIEEHNGTQG